MSRAVIPLIREVYNRNYHSAAVEKRPAAGIRAGGRENYLDSECKLEARSIVLPRCLALSLSLSLSLSLFLSLCLWLSLYGGRKEKKEKPR